VPSNGEATVVRATAGTAHLLLIIDLRALLEPHRRLLPRSNFPMPKLATEPWENWRAPLARPIFSPYAPT